MLGLLEVALVVQPLGLAVRPWLPFMGTMAAFAPMACWALEPLLEAPRRWDHQA